MRSISGRIVSRLILASVLPICLGGSSLYASSFYTVSDRGLYSPEAAYSFDHPISYLNNLSVADQAAFRAGSFDQWAHPAPDRVPGWGYYDDASDANGSSRGWRNSLVAISANNLGQVVGTGRSNSGDIGFIYDPNQQAHFWQDSGVRGLFTDVGGGQSSRAIAINDHGDIIMSGEGFTISAHYHHPYTQAILLSSQLPLRANEMDWSGYGVTPPNPNALNNDGQVVGSSGRLANDPTGTATHAFVFSRGVLEDLNSLIPLSSNITLTSGLGIDGIGRIVATGLDGSGNSHLYLLTPNPVPEPSLLAFAFLVGTGIFVRSRIFQRSSHHRQQRERETRVTG